MTTQPQGFWEAGDLISLARMLLLTTQRGPAPSSTNAAGYDADTDTTWVPYGGAPLAGLRGYDSSTGKQWFTYKDGDHIITESVSLPEDADAVIPSLRTLVDPANLPRFTETPVPTVTGGSGSGATIERVTVTDGRITFVRWDVRGTTYRQGDVLTFHQGTLAIEYTLGASDALVGVLQDLVGVSIGDPRAGNEDRVGATGNHGHSADQLNIQTDGPANVGSLRTLGGDPLQAAPGIHAHAIPDYASEQITASGTWTKPANLYPNAPVIVVMIGGGGGGGRRTSGGQMFQGGAGGSKRVAVYDPDDLPASVPIVVGAGGSGSTSGQGSNGGNSSFNGDAVIGGAGGAPSRVLFSQQAANDGIIGSGNSLGSGGDGGVTVSGLGSWVLRAIGVNSSATGVGGGGGGGSSTVIGPSGISTHRAGSAGSDATDGFGMAGGAGGSGATNTVNAANGSIPGGGGGAPGGTLANGGSEPPRAAGNGARGVVEIHYALTPS